MNRLQVVVDDFESATAFHKGALWSKVLVSVNGWCFPDDNWTDAASAVLIMWIDSILSVYSGASVEVELHYMDGDYRINILSADCIHATAVFIGSSTA